MRVFGLWLLTLFVETKNLQRDLREQEEDATDFPEGAEMVLTVSEGRPVDLPKELQVATWHEIGADQLTLTRAGFKYWIPCPHGFLFKSTDGTERLLCENSVAKSIDSNLEMQFVCSRTDTGLRFKFKSSPASTGSGTTGSARGASANTGTNNAAQTNAASFNNPRFWMPCAGAWPSSDQFSVDYYAVTPTGYWGCPTVSVDGVCATTPMLYPFTAPGGNSGNGAPAPGSAATTGSSSTTASATTNTGR